MKKRIHLSPRTRSILWAVGCGLVFALSLTIIAICLWSRIAFNVSFKELLYTMMTPMEGAGATVVNMAVSFCVPIVCIGAALYVAAAIVILIRKEPIFKKLRRVGVIFCAVFLVFSLIFAVFALRIPEYLRLILTDTKIYEEYYVDPTTVAITADGETKNLIYIYLESMETTYASTDVGGRQGVNYIPNLTALAQQHLSFSDKSGGSLGGFLSPIGTNWTMAALLASTAGIPYSFPVSGINQDMYSEEFAPGLTTMGDILEEKGYRQMFLCGSNGNFAGRKTYFEQHGGYEVYDLFSAQADGHLPSSDYYNGFWGYEDEYLFEIAKVKLAELAGGDKPFNLTLLTLDTHNPDGYFCNHCESTYDTKFENAIVCSDKMVTSFVEWCKEQPFFEDTVIILTGDHPFMSTTLVEDVDYDDRTIYNCFINAAVECQGSTEGRVYTAFDLFPTTLAAMGFQIEGDRLGLGVNLFSLRPTLCEYLGYDYVSTEIQRSSDFYIEKFG